MPVSDEAIRRYRRLLATYRNRTSALLIATWDRLDDYSDEGFDQFVEQTRPAIHGAKVAAVAGSAAFFALALGIRPVGVRADDVPVEPRIRDPFLATWHALNMGRPPAEAILVGRSQTEATAYDFVQHTARRTGDVVAEAAGRDVRWRRVPDGNACDWCHTVSGQLYRTAESADFGHDRDGCVVVPA